MNLGDLSDFQPGEAARSAVLRLSSAFARRWAASIALDANPWVTLHKELDVWRDQKRVARFWWRDDDAVEPTEPLSRLLDTRSALGIPLALAVIPERAQHSLRNRLSGAGGVTVLQHGWCHANHARPGAPDSEFPAHRTREDVAREIRQGHLRLEEMFGGLYAPVFVPPFNHVANKWIATLADAGLRCVSTIGDFYAPRIACKNVHLDVIDWKTKEARPPVQIVRSAVASLRMRRLGLIPSDSPIGVLTHHLDHTEPVWHLTLELFKQLIDHPAASFPHLTEVLSDEHQARSPIAPIRLVALHSVGASGHKPQ
jgi:predicted deacetylase